MQSAPISLIIDTSIDKPVITTTSSDLDQKDATPTIEGTAEADSTVTLLSSGVAIATTTATGGTFSFTTPTLADNTYSLTVTAEDAAGNISEASDALSITVDATAPGKPSIITTTTLTNDATPTIEGIAEAGSTVELVNGDLSLGTTTADATTGAYTIAPTAALDDGAYVLTVTATDAAGNISDASDALSITVDATIAQPTITTTADQLSSDDSTPTIEGTAEAGSTVNLLIGGSTVIATETADESGEFSITTPSLFDNTYSLTVTATDAAGNISDESDALSITIDTGADTPPVITTTDSVINDATPLITGIARGGSTVTLFVDGVTTGITETANGTSGIFSITAPSQLDGTYNIYVQTPNQADNDDLRSASISLTIDTSIAKPVITTASSDLDQSDATPTIAGTAEADSTVTLLSGGVAIGTTTANGDGQFSITTSTLADSNYVLTVTATDAAGNTSDASSALNLTVDTTAPGKPSIITTTSLTNDSTPAIEGTAEAGSTVTLFVDGVTTGVTATADETTGAYTIAPTATLGDGTYALTVTSEDEAGNTSAASDALSITIDATIEQPTITTTADQLNSDDATPTIDGTAEAGSTVNLLIGGNTVIATTTADESGEFSITTPSLFDNDYSLTVTSEDAAGNTSTSDALSITIDTGADANPVITTTDSATNDATPSITGLARPGSTVTLFIGGLTTGVTADADATSGLFSINAPSQEDGTYTIYVTTPNQAGDGGTLQSESISLVIDTSIETPGITTTASDLNPSDATPTIAGTAEADSTVTLLSSGVAIATTTATGGTFSFTTPTLADSNYVLTVTSEDAAGNTSAASSALNLTVDTTAPTQPTIATNIATTTDSTPTIVISADAGSTVTLYNNGAVLGTGVANSLVTITTPQLEDGDYDITATATDSAGNISDSSTELSFSIDSTAPIKPLITTATTLTNDSTPTIEGIAEAGSQVTLLSDGSAIGTSTADEDSSFSIISPEQSDGTCLLYTSPSPRDRQKSRMPSSA